MKSLFRKNRNPDRTHNPQHAALRGATAAVMESLEGRRMLNAGQLDPTFGAGGHVQDLSLPTPRAVAVQNDGRVVEVGDILYNIELARFNANGTPDTSFGYFGRLITDFGGHDYATGLVIQPDGKILVGGRSDGKFVLARYRADGQLDSSFGGGGIAITDFGPSLSGINPQLLLRPDGKILMLGTGSTGSSAEFIFVRYNADGSLDSGFGTGGEVISSAGTVGAVTCAALQPDLKFIIGNSNSDSLIRRYNADGTFDAALHGGGDSLPFHDVVHTIAVQADGKILVGVEQQVAYSVGFFFRDNADGTRDNTFSPPPQPAGSLGLVADDVIARPDGKIIVAGFALVYTDHYSFFGGIQRLNADGSPDSTWGSGGQTAIGTFNTALLAGGPGGTTVVASDVGIPGGQSVDLFRLTGDGTVTPPPPPPGASISGTVYNDANGNGLRDNGEAAAAGRQVYLDIPGIGHFVNGDPATTTDGNGAYSFTGIPAANYLVRLTLPNGNTQTQPGAIYAYQYYIQLGAGATITGKDFGLRTAPVVPVGTSISGSVYYDTNGNAVRDSGEPAVPGRKVYLDLQGLGHQVPADPVATTDSNGNYSFTGLPSANYIVRADDNSVLTAPLFGGFHWVPFSSGPVVSGQDFGVQSVGSSNVRLPDGKVAVEAFAAGVGPSRFTGVTRFNADNSGDQTFGIGGDVPINTGAGTEGGAAQIARLPNGNLLAIFFTPGGPFTALISPSGTLLGSTYASPGTFGSQGVAVQPDNKFLIPSVTVGGSVILHRFNPDLTLDTTFGLGGSVTLPVSGVTRPRIFTVLPDGTIQITYDSGTFLISPNGTLQ